MLMPFELMYRLRFTPWELRPVVPAWQRITDGPDALPPGRALDVGCGTGRDACYLAGRGWQVTGVDIAAAAIARARRRAAAWGMQVRWVVGDVGALGATALLAAFAPARRVLLRGMSQREVTGLFGAAWELVEAEEVTGPGVPPAGPLGASHGLPAHPQGRRRRARDVAVLARAGSEWQCRTQAGSGPCSRAGRFLIWFTARRVRCLG